MPKGNESLAVSRGPGQLLTSVSTAKAERVRCGLGSVSTDISPSKETGLCSSGDP